MALPPLRAPLSDYNAGVTVAFIVDSGAPIEFLQIDRGGDSPNAVGEAAENVRVDGARDAE